MNDFERGFSEELEKVAKKLSTTFAEEHPVATGALLGAGPLAAGAIGAGLHSPQLGRTLMNLGSLGSLGGQWGIAAHEAERARSLTPAQRERGSWFTRHPYWSTFLLGPIGTGITSATTRSALERAGKLEEE